MIKSGNSNVIDVRLGTEPISRIYKGNDLVWKRSPLPIGYQLCEYLESDGAQWINTGIIAKTDTKLESKIFIVRSNINDEYIFSARKHTGNTRFYLLNAHDASGFLASRDAWSTSTFVKVTWGWIDVNNPIEIVSLLSKNETVLSVNGRTFRNDTYLECDYEMPIFMFGGNIGGSAHPSPTGTRIYHAKFTQDNVLVRDYIPCLDNNGRPCMYDTVSQTPFYNQGTGEFSYQLA